MHTYTPRVFVCLHFYTFSIQINLSLRELRYTYIFLSYRGWEDITAVIGLVAFEPCAPFNLSHLLEPCRVLFPIPRCIVTMFCSNFLRKLCINSRNSFRDVCSKTNIHKFDKPMHHIVKISGNNIDAPTQTQL